MTIKNIIKSGALFGFLALNLGACVDNNHMTSNDASMKTTVVDVHNSQNSLDWAGAYKGIIPCADCEGIETAIILKSDGNYTYQTRYLGKGKEVFTQTGKFVWSKDGASISFPDNKDLNGFVVGENQITMLDREGNKITGNLAKNYELQKMPNASLKETYWKLTELMGQKIGSTQNEAYMILKNDGSVNGSYGCNRMIGSFEEKPMERIKFDKMASTMMACLNGMDVEQKFGDVLSRADSYVIVGDTLQLNRARMAPLAKFEAVYLY